MNDFKPPSKNPFEGCTKIIMAPIDLNRAVEFWLNSQVFTGKISVGHVKSSSHGFEVTFKRE
jgi:hypothetical protein